MSPTDIIDRRTFLRGAGLAAAGAIAGCSNGDGSSTPTPADDMGATTTPGMMESATVSWDLGDLPALASGVYEGWAIYGEEKVSTGRFAADDEHTGTLERDPSDANKMVLTIEPEDDPSDAPSGVVYAAGEAMGASAELAFPVSFADAAGSYILATPTNGAESAETSGIWFLDPSGPAPSLDLPDLPDGWVYEGWAVTQGTPLSSGRFSAVDEADSHARYSGNQDGPPFPGEDFLQNAPDGVDFPVDMADGSSKVVVSVEPDIDGMDPQGAAPFPIKPLVGTVPGDATDHTSYDLEQTIGTLPEGEVRIQ